VPTVSVRDQGANKYADVIIAVGIVAIVLMMVIPIPPGLLDFMLALNISLGILILLLTLNISDALELSVFPSLLLVATLFRLALNISSTRLILLEAYAGNIIEAFGNFVVRGNYVVGFIVFLILVIIQFIVITKGAERVAEVAARFTLDAMPGKQMSIDADLNSGLINEAEARQRRRAIEQEADFYGAMDGASKFVKGDAIAGIIITVINIIGGFIVGVWQMGMEFTDALRTYTLLTVGDGLVSQIPALIIAVSTGIIVTRAASDGSMGRDLSVQLFSQYKALFIGAGVLLVIGVLPGFPKLPFLFLAGGAAYLGYKLRQAQSQTAAAAEEHQREAELEQARQPENVLSLLTVDPIELEIGYSLIPMVDPSQGGDVFDRVTLIRRQLAVELGIVIPAIRVRDNMQLKPTQYTIKIKGVIVADGELQVDYFLAMDTGGVMEHIQGIATTEPAFGLPAIWVEASRREEAELAGYTVVDAPSVLATHLTEVIKAHAHSLLGRQEVKTLIDNVKEEYPAVIDELIPDLLNLGGVQKVLQNLLREGIPIRNLVTILEALADFGSLTKNPEVLTEYVRQSLSGQITALYLDEDQVLKVITMDPKIEEQIIQSVQESDQGSYLTLDPTSAAKIMEGIARVYEAAARKAANPVILCSAQSRRHLKRLVERINKRIPVLSFNEISPDAEVQSIGAVTLQQ